MGNKLVNNLKTTILLASLSGMILLLGGAIGGQGGLFIALIIALVMNVGSYFFSAKIALASMGAQEVGPDHPLHRIVSDLVARTDLPMPRVYVSPQPAPNAFATGRNPKHSAVCATEGLLAMLNRNEIAGVMAHELAHVKHRDILISTIAAVMGTVISYIGQMFMFNSLFGGGQSDEEEGGSPLGMVGMLLMAILAPTAAALIQMAISRQREYAADTEGAAICGDPMYLASALEKIHHGADRVPLDAPPAMNALMIAEPRNAMQQFAGLFQTHPPLEKRLMNLIGRESIRGGVRFA
jgi:heat shock protein HtpX